MWGISDISSPFNQIIFLQKSNSQEEIDLNYETMLPCENHLQNINLQEQRKTALKPILFG